MVAPTAKTPRIVNADKVAIVKDPGTLAWNNQTNRLEVVDNVGNFVPTGGGGTIPDNVLLQQLWVNTASGSDANDGGEYTPFATYAAATTFAALTASPTNRFLINFIGDLTEASPVLHPYMDLVFHSGTFTVSGGWSLASAWDNVVNNEVVTLDTMKLAGFWSFSWIGNTGNVIRFLNCDHSLTTSGNFLSNLGASNSLAIYGDTSPEPTGYASFLFITNSNSYIDGLKVKNEIRYDLVLNGLTINHYLNNTQITSSGGIILKKSAPNTSTQTLYVTNTPIPAISMQNDLSNLVADMNSLIVAPVFSGSETYLANVRLQGSNNNLRIIYLNQETGNDLNNGSETSPLANYETARLLAISRGASINLPFLIMNVGNQNITGNMIISANVHVGSFSQYFSGFVVSGDVVIDPNWGTAGSSTEVRNSYIFLSGGNYNLVFPAIDPTGSSFLKFVNCGFNTGQSITITGTGTAVEIENVTFENCTIDDIDYTPGFIAENVNLFLINTDLSVSDITMTASSSIGNNYRLSINDARFYTGNIEVITSGTDTLSTYITASNTFGKTLTINGTFNTVYVDSTSYMFTLALSGGATLGQLVLPTKTDGMVNSTYSALNYIPVSGPTYAASTLTGNLAGLDNALGGKATKITYVETTNLTNIMAVNTEYTANNASTVSLTLPTTSAIGDKITVNGKGAGGWRIDQQNAGHVIHAGVLSTTVGPGGFLASSTQFASTSLVCITANNVWEVQGPSGTFTVV